MNFTKLMEFDTPTQAYPVYAAMTRAEGNEPMGFTQQFIPWWEGLKGLARGSSTTKSARRYVPVRDALEASVAIVNEPTKQEDATMASTTTRSRKSNAQRSSSTPSRRGPLKSAYLHDDPDVAFAAYKKMPHTKSPNARVLTKREFMKAYPAKHAEAVRKEQAKNKQATQAEQTTGQSIVDVLGESWMDADQAVIDALVNAGYTTPEVESDDAPTDAPDPDIIKALAHNAEALAAYLAAFEGTATSTTTTQRSSTKRYRARTDRNDLPGNGDTYGADEDIAPASNAVLWALNTEGLLMTAYEAAEENGDVLGTDNGGDTPYITQAIGKATLTNVFGPQPERQTA